MARTQEEIIKACEKRMAELEAQAERAKAREKEQAAKEAVSCGRCRWLQDDYGRLGHKHPTLYGKCGHPLVKGFEKDAPRCVDRVTRNKTKVPPWEGAALCGEEKALWEPRRTLWGRVKEALSVLFRGPSAARPNTTAKTACTTFLAVLLGCDTEDFSATQGD